MTLSTAAPAYILIDDADTVSIVESNTAEEVVDSLMVSLDNLGEDVVVHILKTFSRWEKLDSDIDELKDTCEKEEWDSIHCIPGRHLYVPGMGIANVIHGTQGVPLERLLDDDIDASIVQIDTEEEVIGIIDNQELKKQVDEAYRDNIISLFDDNPSVDNVISLDDYRNKLRKS